MTIRPDERTSVPVSPAAPETMTPHGASQDEIRAQVLRAAEAASAKKASDLLILEVGPLVGITDYFLLLSASNERLLGTVVDEVEAALRMAHGRKPIGREGAKESGWIVLDYGDYVVHAFTAAQREFYSLERLWRDAVTVPFVDPLEPPAAEAAAEAAEAAEVG